MVQLQATPSGSSNLERSPSARGRGSERGSRRGRGRGRGDSSASAMDVSASGPFALGPGENNASSRRVALRYSTSGLAGSSTSFGLDSTAFGTHLPARSNLGGIGLGFKEEDAEHYSDDDADEPGLQIVGLNDVKALDWMAPETLKKVTEVKRKRRQGQPEPSSGFLSLVTH